MTPESAIKLVQSYSALTRAIKACKKEIGRHLDLCAGLKGFRHEEEPVSPGSSFTVPTERAEADQDTHLKGWYTAEPGDYEYSGMQYLKIGQDEAEECPHCYAAHQVIQRRKTLRRQLAGIKAAMTKGGAA
ncbi:hypothetical protein [Bordetella genomosp. 11]|uniref:Uncharacterized protein n=1 Tax=Bordetella genomosp. 11 TaxID=1416808 RepID=A0A261UEA1_9BORD|nr:hypothetical protein [Bordetella genomosp. 11]OZI59915.1 hypothetical protein CAL28_10525 [Bordetella genomosp. 11]